MKCIIDNQVVLSRPPEGPLAAQIGSFAKSVSEQGYSLVSIHRQVLLAACFSRWLKQKGVGLRSICSDHPARYLRYRARHATTWPGRCCCPQTSHRLFAQGGRDPRRKEISMPTDSG